MSVLKCPRAVAKFDAPTVVAAAGAKLGLLPVTGPTGSIQRFKLLDGCKEFLKSFIYAELHAHNLVHASFGVTFPPGCGQANALAITFCLPEVAMA